MSVLTDRQRREFKELGFLVLDDVLEEATIEESLSRVKTVMSDGLTDDDVQQQSSTHGQIGNRIEDKSPLRKLVREVRPAIEDLTGVGTLAAPDDPPIHECHHDDWLDVFMKYPDEDPEWDSPSAHIDAYTWYNEDPDEEGFEYHPFTVGITIYLDRVQPRGGGFTVWPGSHHLAEKHFQENPIEDKDTRIMERCNLNEMNIGDPFEIAGDPGTTVIWHSLLGHSVGPNKSDYPRIAAIGRQSREDIDEIGWEATRDLWIQFDELRDISL